MAKKAVKKVAPRKASAKSAAPRKSAALAESHESPLAVRNREGFAASAPLVEMRDVSIAFGGIKAVDRASIDLRPGEVVGLLGHNGAGKSTLIKILSGAYQRDQGTILINGDEVTINNQIGRAHV